ncbi:MAG: site-specific integrase [Ktedonobacterales bacterium]|nr:site-specific integrase [Ktedonobacterales bacterium]
MASKRRGNQEGTINKRDDGRWEARMSLPDGKRKSFYGKTKEEVIKKMRKAQRDVDAGLPVISEKQTVEIYLKSWLDIKKHRVDPSTFQRYQYLVDPIIAEIGLVSLAKLSPYHLQALYAKLLEQGWNAGTVSSLHSVFHDALKQAVRLGLVHRNITDMVDPPRREEHEMEVLTEEQVKLLLSSVKDDWFEALYFVVLSTGLRAGEIFALQWQDIDFASRKLEVKRGWQRTNTKTSLSLPKTSHGRRTIVLSQVAKDALMRQRERINKARLEIGDAWDTTHDLVFPGKRGKMYTFKNFNTTQLHPLLKNIGLPLIRFHDLRHTFATLLIGKGVNIKVVSEMLGHSNVSVTLRIYAHVLPHMQEAAAQMVDDVMGGIV